MISTINMSTLVSLYKKRHGLIKDPYRCPDRITGCGMDGHLIIKYRGGLLINKTLYGCPIAIKSAKAYLPVSRATFLRRAGISI